MTDKGPSVPNLSDDEFLTGFLAMSLPPQVFDHRGHLRIAWICLQREPLGEAVQQVCEGIRTFAAHLGASGKYNHTLTEALMRIMAARRAADPSLRWEDFLAANRDLVHDARGLLRRHYSDDRLMSEVARVAFVAPDREPLPAPYERRS